MKKRSVSLFLLLTMIVTLFSVNITASAALSTVVIGNWTKTSRNASDAQFADCFVLSTEEAYSGSYSLKITKPETALSNVQICLRNSVVAGLEPGNYNVSLNMKGVSEQEKGGDHQPGIWVHLEQNDGADEKSTMQWWQSQGWTRTALDNGWYKFEKTFTTTKVMTQFYLELFSVPSDMYIDDISLVKEETEKNLIDGSFEPPADIIPNGWGRYSGGTNSAAYEPYSYTQSNEAVYEGKYSLKVKQQSLSGVQLYLSNSSTLGYEKGEYTITLYVKGSGNPRMKIRRTSGEDLFDLQYWNAKNVNVIRTDAGNGWYKFEKTVTLSDNWGTFHLMVYDAPTEFYVDNISIVKSGTQKNILENGGFEPEASNSYSANTIPYSWFRTASTSATDTQIDSSIELTDTKAYSGTNSIKVKQQSLSGVQFYLRNNFSIPVEVGTYTFSMLVKGEGAPNLKVNIDGAGLSWDLQYYYASSVGVTRSDVGGGWYKFEKTFTTEKTMTQLNLMVYNAKNEFYIDDVSIVKSGSAENIIENGGFEKVSAVANTYPDNTLPADATLYARGVADYTTGNYFTVTNEDAYDGSNALKVYCSETMSGKQISITNDIAETGAGEYDITFYVKGTRNPHINVFLNGFVDKKITLEYETVSLKDNIITSADGWRKYSFTQSVDGSGKGLVIELFSTADVLFDNITVSKHGESENLLTNGSFENVSIKDYNVSEIYVEDYVNYKVSAINNRLDSLNVSLILATYTLDDDGNWVLYKAASDNARLAAGEKDILSVEFNQELIPQDEDRYRFCAYVWDTDALTPLASMIDTKN